MLGTTIDSYAIRSKLGEGGMGTVYLAEHAVLGRRVAIKVLLPEIARFREIVQRFLNEARAASAIHHPSIVEVLDFGTDAQAGAYIVMEYLAGETLHARRVRLLRLDVPLALRIARQIAGGLAAAHARGVVHRDLKPENVFIVADPEVIGRERIKLLDFGIAKVLQQSDEGSLTRTGSVIGTPTYMAPEQCRGSGLVDARADLYALGCVLYELLCGRPPFVANGSGDLIAHHLYFEPTPMREIDPALPEAVERLVTWLMRKDPSERPQSAIEVIEAIDRIALDGAERASSTPAPVPTPVSRPSGRTLPTLHTRPGWFVPAVMVTTLFAAIALYGVWRRDRLTVEPAPIATTHATVQMPPPSPAAPSPPPAPPPEPLPAKVMPKPPAENKHHAAPKPHRQPAPDLGDQGVNPFGP